MHITNLVFAPEQAPHWIELRLVETKEELHAEVSAFSGEPCDPDIYGCCCLHTEEEDHTGRIGFVILCRTHLSRAVLVHELVHAGMHFVEFFSMPEFSGTNKEKKEYFQEACAIIIENLFVQAEKTLLF